MPLVRLQLASLLVVTVGSACLMDPTLPPGALVLCRDDGECPEGACDLVSHTCRSKGADTHGPVVTGATFAPAFARDGTSVTLTLDTDEPVAAEPLPALAFVGGADGTDGGFVPSSSDGEPRVRFSLVVDESVGEGFAIVESATLADAEGNVFTSPIAGAVLQIDRTPPSLDGLVVDDTDGLAGLRLADRAPANEVSVSFRASEIVEVIDVRVGLAALACSDTAGVVFTCTATFGPGDVVDGANLVAVTVADRAGNEASASTSVLVDAAAPLVVDGSVRVEVDGDVDFGVISLGDRVAVELIMNEALAADPVVTLGDDTGIIFVRDAAVSAPRYRFTVTIAQVIEDGVFPVLITSADAFGHEGGPAPLALPAPHEAGLALAAVAPSPCVMPADPDGNTCTDFDGDGVFGASSGCSLGLDCDDGDPRVHPGAFEMPGNGIDDDCGFDGDPALDETTAVFVSATRGSDVAGPDNGSRAAPFRTLAAALDAARFASKLVAVSSGSYEEPAADLAFDVAVLGGLDDDTWEPTAVRTFINLDGGDLLTGGAHLESIDADFITALGANTLVDVGVGSLTVRGPSLVIGSRLVGLSFTNNATGSRVLRSLVNGGFSVDVGAILVDRSQTGRATVGAGGELTMTNSAIAGDSGGLAVCLGCASLRFFHSTLLGAASDPLISVQQLADVPDIVLFNSHVAVAPGGSLLEGDGGIASILSCSFDVSGGTLVVTPGVDAETVDDINQCTFDGCNASGGNYEAPTLIAADALHMAADVVAHPAVDGGSLEILAPLVDAPTTIAGDVDGQCRFAGIPDVGPDER